MMSGSLFAAVRQVKSTLEESVLVDEESEAPFSANIGITSDYIFRGATQTDHDPAMQGGMDWRFKNGLRLGLWGSTIKNEDKKTGAEIDVSTGYGYSFNRSLKASAGVIYFAYLDAWKNSWELPVELKWNAIRFGVSYSPGWGSTTKYWYASTGWSTKLPVEFGLNLSTGRTLYTERGPLKDYQDFKLALSREFIGLDWEIAGTIVDHQQQDGADKPRATLAVTKSF